MLMERNGTHGMPFLLLLFFLLGISILKIMAAQNVETTTAGVPGPCGAIHSPVLAHQGHPFLKLLEFFHSFLIHHIFLFSFSFFFAWSAAWLDDSCVTGEWLL